MKILCFLFGHKLIKTKAKRFKGMNIPIQATTGDGKEFSFMVSDGFGDKYTDYVLNRCTRCGKWWIDTYAKGSI